MATYIADRYRLKKKDIGGGNMASILLCEDTDIEDDEVDRSVIVKMFNKPNIGDEHLQKQVFNREVESLEKLNNKNIVRILDRGYDEGFNAFFIVLEYIQGQNFKEAFEDICRYDYTQKLELMEQVVEGIEYLHKKNIVHRDLKPSNLMFDKDGTVKIIDFGISRLQDTFYSDYTLAAFATKNYSSPEQMAGKTITYQSDIYSLGLIFYEIFTCTHITTRESMDVSSLPQGMQNILVKMTKEEPNLRYGTITELKKDIEKERSLLVQERYIKWVCKYHIVFTPKYRRKIIYNQYKESIRDIIKQLCAYKGVEIIEGHLMPDHMHILVSIPPKISVSSFMGYLKGKSALMIFDKHANLKYKFGNRHFWQKDIM